MELEDLPGPVSERRFRDLVGRRFRHEFGLSIDAAAAVVTRWHEYERDVMTFDLHYNSSAWTGR